MKTPPDSLLLSLLSTKSKTNNHRRILFAFIGVIGVCGGLFIASTSVRSASERLLVRMGIAHPTHKPARAAKALPVPGVHDPVPTTCGENFAIFANQHNDLPPGIDPADFELEISGSNQTINGRAHSNSDMLFSGSTSVVSDKTSAHLLLRTSGSSNVFEDALGEFFDVTGSNNTWDDDPNFPVVGGNPVQWVTSFAGNLPSGNVFRDGNMQVAGSPVLGPPVTFNVSDYAPGGPKALAAGSDYHSHVGNKTFTAPELNAGGLWHVNGNVVVSQNNIASNITIVATGTIDMSGQNQDLISFVDDILLFSSKVDASSSFIIKTAGSGNNAGDQNTYDGIIYGPGGVIDISGQWATYTTLVLGDRVKVAGSNLTFNASDFLCEPSFTVTKTPNPTSVSQAGTVITYTIVVDNTGNQNLTGVTITDPLINGGFGSGLSGPTGDDGDGILETNETWTFTGTYTVQQSDLNNNGIDSNGVADGDGDIDNTVTVDTEETPSQQASAEVDIVQAPKLIVIKHVVNDNGGTAVASDFTLTVDDSGSNPPSIPGAEAPGTEVTVDPGSYTVTETGPSGYTASFSADCTGTIANGETKTCTVTNDDQAATLIVIKNVINDNGGTAVASDFSLDSGGPNDSPDNFPGAGAPGTSVTLDAGSYNVTETGPSGYNASFSADCAGSIANGQTKTCTVTNNDIAPKLTVIKHVVNDNGGTAVASDFTMTVDDPASNPPSFPGAESPGTEVTVDAGAYTVTETGPGGYTASFSSDCTGTLAVGETKTCTVTNDDQAATLIVIKNVINDNGGTAVASDFSLDSGGANDSPDNFPGAGTPGTSVSLDAGSYNVTETGPTGYNASFSADCTGTIGNGQTKTCTVTNNDIAPRLTVIKHVINDNGGTASASNFTMTVDDPGTNPPSFPGAESPGTEVVVDAGAYSVTESGPTGYAASFSADCTGSIAVGENKTCTVTNDDISPTLTVNKVCNPSNDTGLFNLQIDSVTRKSDATCGGVNGTTGAIGVNAGNHTVSETAGTGTNLSDYVAVIGGDCASNGTVSLTLGQNKTCTITNTKKGMAQVIKTVNGGAIPAGTQPFIFQLRQNAVPAFPNGEGTVLESVNATVADPTADFTTKLIPGNTYQLCEVIMPGWLTSLVGFVPNSIGNPIVDNSPICVNFTVTAGETKVFNVNNTPPPGGRALTIGFWKNWSACSGGNQRDVLGQTLGSFALPPSPLPNPAPNPLPTTRGVYIGDLYVDTCLEAIRVLDKATVNTGKKMASDPAFNLAAQLLAAKLNVQAGAGVNPCVTMAISDAQAKLDQLNFNGITHGSISKSLATVLNNLANTLDRYNNNLSCP